MVGDDQFRLTGSARGFSGRLISVRIDNYETPGGRNVRREVVEHPSAVAVVAMTRANQVILVRQYRHSIGRSLIELPAGLIDSGEKPEESAHRELLEETGFAAESMIPVASIFASPGYSDEVISIFHAPDCRQVFDGPREGEPVELEMLSLDEAAAWLSRINDEPVDGKTVFGLTWLLEHRSN